MLCCIVQDLLKYINIQNPAIEEGMHRGKVFFLKKRFNKFNKHFEGKLVEMFGASENDNILIFFK